jgi:hypothetical protein
LSNALAHLSALVCEQREQRLHGFSARCFSFDWTIQHCIFESPAASRSSGLSPGIYTSRGEMPNQVRAPLRGSCVLAAVLAQSAHEHCCEHSNSAMGCATLCCFAAPAAVSI